MDASSDEGTTFTTFEYLSDAIVVADARFDPPGPKVVYVNDAFAAACGRSRAELIGEPLTTLHPGLHGSDRLERLGTCCRDKRTYRNKGPLAKSDGSEVSAAWHIAPVFRGETLNHLLCLVNPVTDTPAFVNTQRASEPRFRNLFEQGRIGKAILTTDGRFAEVNQSFCDLVGYERDELIGAHGSLVINEDERDAAAQRVRELAEGKRTGYQAERRYVHKDGHLVSALVDVAHEKDEKGEVCALVVQAQDITGLKATEAELRESESQLKAIFDHSPAEVYLKDVEGRYVKINRQFERMFNVRDEDLKGKLPHDAHYEELAERTRAHDLQVLRTGKVVVREEEVYLENPPDSFPHVLHTIKFPIFDNGRVTGLGAIATDITDMKRAEHALRESESRLRDFAEIAADWFWETDENLVITYISDVHRTATGIPDECILGRTRAELFRDGVYEALNPAVHLRTLENYWESMVEYTVTRSDNQKVVIHDRATPFFDADGNFRGYRGVGRDITEQKRLNSRVTWQATHDPLTGVVNRREFERCLGEAVMEARVQGDEHVLSFIDLNKFKLLNDTLGHAAGDYTLNTIVEEIQKYLSPRDLLGRIGGDEFGILMRNTSIADAKRTAEKITRSVGAHEFKWQGRVFNIALSIGLVPLEKNTKSTSQLMARADSACYRAKEHGDGVWVSDEIEAARLKTYSDILSSLADGPIDLSDSVELVGQPICALSESRGHAAWYEVLLRLVGDDGRYYRPYEFVRLAEQHGKMPLIDHWVLEQAIVAHERLIEHTPDAVMSINVADNSLTRERLQELTDGVLKNSPVRPENLCFEISEATATIDLEQTVGLATSLSEQGFRVALDEFGSGPSSFECLKSLPVDYIKLYGTLIRKLRKQGPELAIVQSMQELSRRLGVTMVAVQVETEEAARALRRIGVEYGQGDALATIRPLDTLISELAETHSATTAGDIAPN